MEISRRQGVVGIVGIIGTLACVGAGSSDDDDGSDDGDGSDSGAGAPIDDSGDDNSGNGDDNGDGSGDDGDGGGDESSDGEEPEGEEDLSNLEQGENQLTFGDLEITEHELVVEENSFGEEVTINGIVQNSGDSYDYVEVQVRLYDEDGHMLDNYYDNSENLQAEGSWRFEVNLFNVQTDEFEEYDIAVSGSRYDF